MIRPVLGKSGLGFFEMESNDALYFGHNGADAGFQALLIASREGGHGAAIMVNSDNGIQLAMEILPAIARSFDWPGFAPEPLQPAPVEPEALEALVGVYQVRDHVALEVSREGTILIGRVLLDSESTRLVPTEEGTFIAQDDGSILEFELGDDGRSVGYRPAGDPEAAMRHRLPDGVALDLAQLDEGRTDQALKLLIESDRDESYLNQLGYTLLGANRAEQAVAIFRLNIERNPNSANAWDGLGDGFLALGDESAAVEAFRQVLPLLAGDQQIPEQFKPQVEGRARAHIRRFGVDSGKD
jgi:tetratricopeptide (TPR) repeat protein